eukprot:jgi/Mesvir1/3236/Mv16379-RA.1
MERCVSVTFGCCLAAKSTGFNLPQARNFAHADKHSIFLPLQQAHSPSFIRASNGQEGCSIGPRKLSGRARTLRPSATSPPLESIGLKEEAKPIAHKNEREWDVLTLANICVDVVMPVETLPPPDIEGKRRYMDELQSRTTPDLKFCEAGGSANFLIAASRIGLHCGALGHWGRFDDFGNFMERVMEDEGIALMEIIEDDQRQHLSKRTLDEMRRTLLCWVLVDPSGRHAFFSRFDVSTSPLFETLGRLSDKMHTRLQSSKAVYVNGFVFDELTGAAVTAAVASAHEAGSCIFFDVGPRGSSLVRGDEDKRNAFMAVLDTAAVILTTLDEAHAITGATEPAEVASILFHRSHTLDWVVVKLGADGCQVIRRNGTVHRQAALQVEVADTVGCGDSFAAAVVLGYCRGAELGPTIALANALGAATAMRQGAGRNVADEATIRALLQQHIEAAETMGRIAGRNAAEERRNALAALAMLDESKAKASARKRS